MNKIENDYFKEKLDRFLTRSHSDTFGLIFDQILDHNCCNCLTGKSTSISEGSPSILARLLVTKRWDKERRGASSKLVVAGEHTVVVVP